VFYGPQTVRIIGYVYKGYRCVQVGLCDSVEMIFILLLHDPSYAKAAIKEDRLSQMDRATFEVNDIKSKPDEVYFNCNA